MTINLDLEGNMSLNFSKGFDIVYHKIFLVRECARRWLQIAKNTRFVRVSNKINLTQLNVCIKLST